MAAHEMIIEEEKEEDEDTVPMVDDEELLEWAREIFGDDEVNILKAEDALSDECEDGKEPEGTTQAMLEGDGPEEGEDGDAVDRDWKRLQGKLTGDSHGDTLPWLESTSLVEAAAMQDK